MQCLNTGGRKGKNHEVKEQRKGRPWVVDMVFTSGPQRGGHIGLVLPLPPHHFSYPPAKPVTSGIV